MKFERRPKNLESLFSRNFPSPTCQTLIVKAFAQYILSLLQTKKTSGCLACPKASQYLRYTQRFSRLLPTRISWSIRSKRIRSLIESLPSQDRLKASSKQPHSLSLLGWTTTQTKSRSSQLFARKSKSWATDPSVTWSAIRWHTRWLRTNAKRFNASAPLKDISTNPFVCRKMDQQPKVKWAKYWL